MPEYTYSTDRNSYFNGSDLRITREDGEDIVVSIKDSMWSVNVKSDLTRGELKPATQLALANLPERVVEGIEHQAKELWWRQADETAKKYGFNAVYQEGRSGGWAALDGTQSWEPGDIFREDDRETTNFINCAFALVELIESAVIDFEERMAEAHTELQLELRQYADWVGAIIRSLDGDLAEVTKLKVINGRPALRTAAGWFSFATEATLVRKADGNIPARLTADPIMEQVFRILEARGDNGLDKTVIDAFLDSDPARDPIKLYERLVGRAVDELEAEIEHWNEFDSEGDEEPTFGEPEFSPFTKNEEGEWPPYTAYLYELSDGDLFEDEQGRLFNRVGHGPVQGSIQIVDDEETHAYWDSTVRVKLHTEFDRLTLRLKQMLEREPEDGAWSEPDVRILTDIAAKFSRLKKDEPHRAVEIDAQRKRLRTTLGLDF